MARFTALKKYKTRPALRQPGLFKSHGNLRRLGYEPELRDKPHHLGKARC
jgi:hypothetical protein